MSVIRPVPDRAFAEWAGSGLVAAVVVATSVFGQVGIPGLGRVLLGTIALTAALGLLVRRCGSVRFTAEHIVVTQAWWPPYRVRWSQVTGADLVGDTDQEDSAPTFRTLVLRLRAGSPDGLVERLRWRGRTYRSLKVPVRFPLDPSSPESAAAALCRHELADHGIHLRR